MIAKTWEKSETETSYNNHDNRFQCEMGDQPQQLETKTVEP